MSLLLQLASGCLPPIGEKFFEPLVCQLMIKELDHHLERIVATVSANARSFDNVNGMSNTGG